MAGQMLTTGSGPRRRAFFGLLDADSWSWASLKAFAWFVLIIFLLGYIPDRAYYFTVFPTIDVGLLAWSPVNLCPPENETLPCPAPAGAVLPWQPSPAQISLPAARTHGAAVVVGSKLVYVGGSTEADGAPTDTVFISNLYPGGNFSEWSAGPTLPVAVKDASVAVVGSEVVVLGGTDAAGKPTTGAYVAKVDTATGALGDWQTAKDAGLPIDLPEARSGASVAVAGDGLYLVGGIGPKGVVDSVWRSALDKDGKLTAWVPQASLVRPQAHAGVAILGSYLWVYGGSDANGPVGAVQRGEIGPAGSAEAGAIVRFGIKDGLPNLPVARTGAATFTSNGALYLVGGNDGQGPKGELYWTTPTAKGEITEWHHLAVSDLPAESALAGSSAVVNGSEVFLIGGHTATSAIAAAARANLAPKPPFFQLGLVGATVPALKIDGEIGQQLGYLNAAGAGTVNFILLIVIGYLVAHPEKRRALVERIRRR